MGADAFERHSEGDDWMLAWHFIHSGIAARIASVLNEECDGPPPTAPTVVENLPHVKLTRSNCNGQCVVCQENFQCGDDVTGLPCKHRFHRKCVVPWLQNNNTCPTCRFELPKKDSDEDRDISEEQDEEVDGLFSFARQRSEPSPRSIFAAAAAAAEAIVERQEVAARREQPERRRRSNDDTDVESSSRRSPKRRRVGRSSSSDDPSSRSGGSSSSSSISSSSSSSVPLTTEVTPIELADSSS